MTVEAPQRHSLRTTGIGVGLLTVAMFALSACSSGSTAAPAASSTSASTSAVVVTSTSDAVVTATDTVTDTADVTRTDDVTRTRTAEPTSAGNGGGGGGADSTPTGGDDQSGTAPNSCPDDATLRGVTPNYDPQYPINSINCAQDWAVGTYEADGKNQTTGIWRETSGTWAFQDRATVCAQADNLPPELYSLACTGN